MCWIQIETPKTRCFNPGWQVGSFAMGRAGTIAELDVDRQVQVSARGRSLLLPCFSGQTVVQGTSVDWTIPSHPPQLDWKTSALVS
jgi:hypothetical protein